VLLVAERAARSSALFVVNHGRRAGGLKPASHALARVGFR